jgi:hypothetical protein
MLQQEVKIRMSLVDLQIIDEQAVMLGTNRSALIRDRVLSAPVASISTADYHRLVSDACAFMRNDLNQRHVETLVAYVITRLHQHSSQAATGDQSAA